MPEKVAKYPFRAQNYNFFLIFCHIEFAISKFISNFVPKIEDLRIKWKNSSEHIPIWWSIPMLPSAEH